MGGPRQAAKGDGPAAAAAAAEVALQGIRTGVKDKPFFKE